MEFVRLMSGHTRKVTSMALDPQSGQLFTGSHDGNVRVWNLQSGDCSAVLPAHGDVDSLLFESGFLFAGVKTASGPGQVRVWAPGGGESVLEGHQGQVLALAAANGALFSAGQDCTIRVWTPTPAPPPGSPTFHCSAVLSQEMGGHAQPVNCLCISGPWLFSADFGGTIKVWSLAQGSLTQTLERAHSDARVPAITHLLVCDSHLVSAALDGRLKVWTPVEGGAGAGAVVAETPAFVWPELEAVQQGKRGGRGAPPPLAGILAVQGVTDPEGKALLAVSFNGEKCVRLFEWPTFNDRGTFAEVINARGMAAIGQFFVAGDERGKVKVWRYKAAAQGRAADASVGAF